MRLRARFTALFAILVGARRRLPRARLRRDRAPLRRGPRVGPLPPRARAPRRGPRQRRARRRGARRVPAARGGGPRVPDHLHRRGRPGPRRHRPAAGRRARHGEPRQPRGGPRRGRDRHRRARAACRRPSRSRCSTWRASCRTAASCGWPSRRPGSARSSSATSGRCAAAIVGACLLLFLIGASASRRFSEPIAELTRAASAVAAGDFARDLPSGGGEEVQLLGGAHAAHEELVERGGPARRGRAPPDRDGLRAASRTGSWSWTRSCACSSATAASRR